jgi:DNA-binding MarR family transcriptional regulator
VTDITTASRLTQGAISQTVSLMLKDDLVVRHDLEDGRKSGLKLTRRGLELLKRLEPHWETTFRAIGALETEIGVPLLDMLGSLAAALERQGFADRLADAERAGKTDG